ncbi:MAG TPA: 30S ribosome-binding factor RbfA [Bacillota bacterium]|nr:30S ribosome-binding factor RbfA [Bacillota bacterium]HOK68376.1 30S ribosome-binding factor RbfA [Bacillota bacterium]HPP85526.1 30S ribosome-binding factor RbfA [Bacillota bacterium]
MPGFRQDKINEQVARELAEIIRTVKDPRISGSFISIVQASVTKDLSLAKIYYSVVGPDNDVDKGLDSASGYIRKELASRLNLRVTPKLVFIRDHSAERAIGISKILKDIENQQS